MNFSETAYDLSKQSSLIGLRVSSSRRFPASASIWGASCLEELQIPGELMRNYATSKRQARAEIAASTLAAFDEGLEHMELVLHGIELLLLRYRFD